MYGGSNPPFQSRLLLNHCTCIPKKDGGIGPRFGVGPNDPGVYETAASSTQKVAGGRHEIATSAVSVVVM